MQGRSKLELEPAELREIADRLAERITVGLARGGTEIAALPAYLPPPSRALSGRALVMDTGGTNMRAAIVELGQGRAQITGGPVRAKLPVREQGALIDGEAFFRIQAELAAQLSGAQGLAVGYCFSYPSEVLPSRDGKLIRWTKGVEIPGVEGKIGRAHV